MSKSRLRPETIEALIEQSLAIEADEASEAGAIGFMARAMTLASLPHGKTAGNEFARHNGPFTLSIMSPSEIGLPYGSIPRLLLAWLTTEAVRKKERELELGDSMSAFMRQLDLVPTGGRWGSIARLRDQTTRLFASSFTAVYRDKDVFALRGHRIADKAVLWWEPRNPAQGSLWQSTVTLSEPFFTEIVERPVPIDMRALKALRKSPMALDIYTWLTYRMSYLKTPVEVPWGSLQRQFGAGYPETAQGLRDFRKKYISALLKVLTIYPAARIESLEHGIKMMPSRPHIRTR
jgi:Plasmid encoded RepA protein